MNTTSDSREHILDFIVAHGGATVAQLCAAMRSRLDGAPVIWRIRRAASVSE